MNGDATSVAIIVLPSGSNSISGADTKKYISDAKGMPSTEKILNNTITLSNLDLSSSK
jgi:hypothetical protein